MKPAGPPRSRETLLNFFKQGEMPKAESFAALINSAVNRLDDNLNSSPTEGWQMAPPAGQTGLMAFYQSHRVTQAGPAAWVLELPMPHGQLVPGLRFRVPAGVGGASAPAPALYLHPGGNVGLGTDAPAERLDVRGAVASQGRIGTFQADAHTAKADGEWHTIADGLDGLHAFEVVAAAYGPTGQGRYAIAYAMALSAFGKSRSRIFHRNAWFGGRFQKIRLRWDGEQHNYRLQIRTASNFGPDCPLIYHITQLFDNRGQPAKVAEPPHRPPNRPAA